MIHDRYCSIHRRRRVVTKSAAIASIECKTAKIVFKALPGRRKTLRSTRSKATKLREREREREGASDCNFGHSYRKVQTILKICL